MITVEHLSKSFPGQGGPVVALDDVSLSVAAGAICGVVGASGAGKSMLARCIALLDRPDSGVVRVGDTDLVALRGTDLRRARRQIGVVPQGESLLRQRTAAGNIALPLQAAGLSTVDIRRRVGQLLTLVGLAGRAGAYPDQLSGGQRQRIAVARALAAKPSVLLADEPTSALDPQTTESVLDLFDRVRAELGVTVLIVTHDMGVVRRVCDDIAVLADGRVVEHGTILDLLTESGSRTAAALLPSVEENTGNDTGGRKSTVDSRYARVVDVVLIGYAAIGTLLPAAARHGAELSLLGGGITRVSDTPVTRIRVGIDGDGADAAIRWLVAHGATVQPVDGSPVITRSGRPRRTEEVA